jgi:hypothetical protein
MKDNADDGDDIYAQLDRLDESLNNELEDLKRTGLLEEESTFANTKQTEEVASEPDNSDVSEDYCSSDNNDAEQPQPAEQEVNDIISGNQEDADTTGKSKSNGGRRQRNTQRGKREDATEGSRSTLNQRKKQQNQPKQSGVAHEIDKNSSITEKRTQPARNEGHGRGSRRRRAQGRHQEEDKQQNGEQPASSRNEILDESLAEAESKENASSKIKDGHDVEDTKKPKDEPGEGKGRRARSRRTRLGRGQQKIQEQKKVNLSSEQKQKIIDSLDQGRNNFLSK